MRMMALSRPSTTARKDDVSPAMRGRVLYRLAQRAREHGRTRGPHAVEWAEGMNNPLVTPVRRRRRPRLAKRPRVIETTAQRVPVTEQVFARPSRGAASGEGALDRRAAPARLVNAAAVGAARCGLRGLQVPTAASVAQEAAEHMQRAGEPNDDVEVGGVAPRPGPVRSWTASALDRLRVQLAREQVAAVAEGRLAGVSPVFGTQATVLAVAEVLAKARADAEKGTWVDAKLAELGVGSGDDDDDGVGSGDDDDEEVKGDDNSAAAVKYHALSGFARKAEQLLAQSQAVRAQFSRVAAEWEPDVQEPPMTPEPSVTSVPDMSVMPMQSMAYLASLNKPPRSPNRSSPVSPSSPPSPRDRLLFRPDAVSDLVARSKALRQQWSAARHQWKVDEKARRRMEEEDEEWEF